jgi:hypothetical protein
MSRQLATALTLALAMTGRAPVSSALSNSRQQASPRDRGGARISGVTSDPQGAPIVDAGLTLCQKGGNCQFAKSDAEGKFAFSALTENVYFLRAEKFGYLRAEFGALRSEGLGTPIALASAQRLDVTLTMARTGSVSGTVRGTDGRPVAGIFVGLNRPGQSGGFGLEKTRDDGTYRIDGVYAGDYYVMAGIVGRRETVPTFYPSAPSALTATIVKVKNGEERDRIDILLLDVPPVSLRGVVLDPAGMPVPAAQLSMVPHSGFESAGCAVEADGAFSCTGLAPGRYALFAISPAMPPDPSSRPKPIFKPADALEARVELDVPVEGISNFALRLRRGIVFSGRVVFDGVKLKPPAGMNDIEIRLDRPGWMPYGAKVAQDGTFSWTGLPEKLTLSASVSHAPAPGWVLRSAMWQGRDLLQTGLNLDDATGDVTGAVLTFTDRHSGIVGVVRSEDGRPDAACTVIVFSTTAGPWPEYSPRIASDRPATNGKFEFRDLPAGAYYIVTVRDPGNDDWRAPEFLRPLIPRALRITLREGEQINLTLVSPVSSVPSVSPVRRVSDRLH